MHPIIIDLRHIDTMMTMEEASVSTSIWPLTRRDVGSGRKKLNPLQKEAIKIACNNHFTIIQGPPGRSMSISYKQGLALLTSCCTQFVFYIMQLYLHTCYINRVQFLQL